MTDSIDPTLLTRQTEHLRALARGLVGADDAEDLVQDTFVRAIEQPPRMRSKLTNWLSVVLRNRARQRGAADARRRERERAAARPEHENSAESSRFAMCMRIVAAVDALPTKYREVVTLRFFDELPPREIARRLDVPVNTVRTRTARALERLRTMLDEDHGGDRATWMAVLAPFASPERIVVAGTAAAGTGVALVQTKSKLAIACLLLIGTGFAVSAAFLDPPAAEPGPVANAEDAITRQAGSIASDASNATSPAEDVASNPGTERQAIEAAGWTVRGIARIPGSSTPPAGVALRVSAFADVDGTRLIHSATFTTKADGTFTWTDTPLEQTATLVFESQDRGWHCDENTWVAVAGKTPPQDVELDLTQLDGVVRGRILDPDGTAVAGATVRCGTRPSGNSDAEGRYEVRFAANRNRVAVRVRAHGFAFRTERIVLEPGVRETTRDIVLEPGRRIVGTVRDENGRPIEGAKLYAFRSFDVSTRTGADGRFVLDWIDPEIEREHVAVRHRGYRDANGTVTIDGDESELDLVMTRGATCSGRVVTPDGQPVAGALVYWRPEALNNGDADGITGSDGEFELTGGARYWSRIGVRHRGHALTFQSLPQLAETFDVTDVVVVLRPGRTIGGIVSDMQDRPLAGVSVFADLSGPEDDHSRSLGLLASTGADGSFELRDMPVDAVSLTFVETGYLRAHEKEIVGPRHDLRVRLERVAGVAGTVLDATTGAPVEDFAVRFLRVDAAPGETAITRYWAAWTRGLEFHDRNGHWATREHEELETGGVIGVQIRAEGYAPSVVRKARATTDALPQDFVTRLLPGATVAGSIVDHETGAPIAEARVYLLQTSDEVLSPYSLHSNSIAQVVTEEDGKFAFSRAARGDVRIAVTHERFANRLDGPFTVPAAVDSIERRIVLDTGARVHGRVLNADGTPRANTRVQISGESVLGVYSDEVTTNAAGAFSFTRVTAGEHTVAVAKPVDGGVSYPVQRQITVKARESVEVELRLQSEDAK